MMTILVDRSFQDETRRLLEALAAQVQAHSGKNDEAEHFIAHGEFGLALESLMRGFDGSGIPSGLQSEITALASRMGIDHDRLMAGTWRW